LEHRRSGRDHRAVDECERACEEDLPQVSGAYVIGPVKTEHRSVKHRPRLADQRLSQAGTWSCHDRRLVVLT
jgi:hypothetical protein